MLLITEHDQKQISLKHKQHTKKEGWLITVCPTFAFTGSYVSLHCSRRGFLDAVHKKKGKIP